MQDLRTLPSLETNDGVPDPEDADGDTDDMVEDDMQSVIGVSISRAQTRLRSPTTPAVERAAVLENYGRDGFFDPDVWTQDRQSFHSLSRDHDHRPRVYSSPDAQKTHEAHLSDGITLPSPWVAAPKLFERHATQSSRYERQNAERRAPTGPMGLLADLSIKRFISSFSLPALPKPLAIRDLQLPSLPQLIGTKADSQAPANRTRSSRANTIGSSELPWPIQSTYSTFTRKPTSRDHEKHSPTSSHGQLQSTQLDGPADELGDGPHSPQRYLKRASSDQSLALHRASSLASSLGDDSRWTNVQKQVNSRAKAISDSLQDSNIRLPSLPSLPSVNFFRPDFLRNRAASDVSRPTQPSDGHPTKPMTVPERQQNTPDLTCSQLDRALDSLTGDIVVLGGYRGSVLRSATPPHRQLWVPVKVGLNIRKVNLEVGLDPEDELKMEDTIIPSGMLSHIGPIDMGRRLLKRLRSCRNARDGKLRVHDYGYDWRLSPHLSSEKLIGYLEHLRVVSKALREGEQGVVVIAHSLGGLIARHAVNQRPDLFAGVLYAGVPQHCINILGPLRNGDEVLLSSRVLTAQVNFTLRTSFLLLPDSGRCFVDKKSKEEYHVNFFDCSEWKRYALSPCIAAASPPFTAPERKGLFSSVADSLPSLPFMGRGAEQFSDKTGSEKHGISAMIDPDPHLDQQTNHTGPSTSPQSTIPLAKAEEYLKRTLADTLRFKQEMKFSKAHALDNRYPPLSILYGTSVPTVSRARVTSRAAIKCRDVYDDLEFASGDGVCLARAAMLPPGYECVTGGKVRTERGHVGLLGDLNAVGKCLISIIDGRKKGIGLGQGHPKDTIMD
ncbi:MAG: hypothetical protein Q9218_004354 [Villophora microphyllina]